MNNVLKVQELRKTFGSATVLDGLTFDIRLGEVVSLIGSSGSGKSTVLRCINFLEPPTSGCISVMGESIALTADRQGAPRIDSARTIRTIRRQVGMVFQSFNLWPHRTVLQNVAEAPIYVLGMSRRAAEEEALDALAKVGMTGFRDRYPAHLSGGQQQRVAIARVLAMRPRLMLFDEPTSALDPELVGGVLKVIRALAEEGSTILLVTHEMAFARDVSSRMIFLHKGRIEQDDTPQVLFGQPASEPVRRFLAGVAATPGRLPAQPG
ncbi:ATP-binding cassette domain-containing protein [Brucella intermedia]|uniref:ATP-binding cassette domain-containing protein n=1 Tax=Brucella intermedia TaxID=94625 RepID=UPI0022498E5E|nr:amino acid ABC transporter ATP-binding protein [Brucella intermedia]